MKLQLAFSHHHGFWWLGALAPRHQWPQCWVCIHVFPVVYGLRIIKTFSFIFLEYSGHTRSITLAMIIQDKQFFCLPWGRITTASVITVLQFLKITGNVNILLYFMNLMQLSKAYNIYYFQCSAAVSSGGCISIPWVGCPWPEALIRGWTATQAAQRDTRASCKQVMSAFDSHICSALLLKV